MGDRSIGRGVVCLVVGLAFGCSIGAEGDYDGPAPSVAQPADLVAIFANASVEHGVPEELLQGIAWAETRWTMVWPEPGAHTHGLPPAFGVMALRAERASEGARLIGASLDDVRTEAAPNVHAAAAWLARTAGELGIDASDPLEAWAPVLEAYSGIDDPVARTLYADMDVFGALRRGFVARDGEGQVIGRVAPQRIERIEVPASVAVGPIGRTTQALDPGPDYPDAVWRASPNHSSRPSGSPGDIQMVIIHSCEGSYAGCWATLTSSSSGVSAHYVVNADGSEISQMVTEARKAWHIGATYSCSLNDDTRCNLSGYGSNGFTVGVEHAGFASQTTWDSGLLDESAKLVCDITEEYGIPRDANHIVAHGQLQANRTDPGANWPWQAYIDLVRQHCGDTTFSEIVVDDDDANNDSTVASFSASSSWIASGYSGYWGSGYRYASTQPISDTADFWFYLEAGGDHTIDAHWVAGANRSTAAPFLFYDASSTLVGSTTADQTTNGSAWNELGTYTFSAGWNRVALSRWAAAGSVVVADAVRVR